MFLTGEIPGQFTIAAMPVDPGEFEARVQMVVFGDNGAVHASDFAMIGDDDEDDRWHILYVFTDTGGHLLAVLAPPYWRPKAR